MKSKISLNELESFLKTLKNGDDRFERLRAYVRQLEIDNAPIAEKTKLHFLHKMDNYFALEDHFNSVIENFLTVEERDLIVSYYMHGVSVESLILSKFISRRTFYYQLKSIKEKIVANW